MSGLYLYHATDRKNLAAIKENGLLIHPPNHNWEQINCANRIFLALSASAAEEYVKDADTPPENLVMLKIDLDMLNMSSIKYDWNNRCEYVKDINSCVCCSDIPGNLLQECNISTEPSQSIYDFYGTELYDILYDTFWDECETNLERKD